jgi:hypothetical protein
MKIKTLIVTCLVYIGFGQVVIAFGKLPLTLCFVFEAVVFISCAILAAASEIIE